MIRVLHCIETIASGGVEQTVLTLIKGLDKNKFSHKIICTWAGGPVAEALEKEGVEIISVGSFRSPFEWKKLKQVIKISKAYRPHLIHGAVFEGMTMASVVGLFSKSPIVVLEETSDPQNRSKKANLLLKAFSFRANSIQAISEEVAEYLVKKTKINPKKITVIPNGVQEPKILSEEEKLKLRKKYGLTKDDFVVGFVGRLHNEHKRFTDLLEAVSKLENESIKILIVGDGKERDLLESEIIRLGINDRVIHVGFQGSPHPFYDMMDILCVPSAREGFGLVAVEGMFHKLPIIASAVGGLKGVVKDGETGYHINPYSPQKLSLIISQLYAQPSLCQELGIKGYKRALENYSADIYVEKVKSLYMGLLKRGGFEFK